MSAIGRRVQMRLLERLLIDGDAQNTCSKRDVVAANTNTKTAYGIHVVGKATYSKNMHMVAQPASAQGPMRFTGDYMHYFVTAK